MDYKKALAISENQKENLKQKNKKLRGEIVTLRDKIKELLSKD